MVFVTPVDDFWKQLTAARFLSDRNPFPDPGPADQVCDYLGLPYRNTWLVELRSRRTLGQLVDAGKLRMAAPTVFEAWGHDYFRHWSRRDPADRWGRTLHVAVGSIGRAEPPGLPEVILDHLPRTLLSDADAFEVAILGRVTTRPVPDQTEVNHFLLDRRELKVLVQEIVSRVMHE